MEFFSKIPMNTFPKGCVTKHAQNESPLCPRVSADIPEPSGVNGQRG